MNKKRHPLQVIRKERGMTQQTLADLLKTPRSNISMIEGRKTPISLEFAQRWGLALMVNPMILLELEVYLKKDWFRRCRSLIDEQPEA